MISSSCQRQQPSLSRALAGVGLLLAFVTALVSGQSQRFCEGELGEANWACDAVSPIPPEVFEEFLPLPGSPDPSNPTKYKQIAGEPAFDEDTGIRSDGSAVFVLTEGLYFCMLAESNGVAVLFDAPEGLDLQNRPRADYRVQFYGCTGVPTADCCTIHLVVSSWRSRPWIYVSTRRS